MPIASRQRIFVQLVPGVRILCPDVTILFVIRMRSPFLRSGIRRIFDHLNPR